jgi:FtsP/CotA-like multicopper oxidase with cupredoxin domain
MPKDEKAATDIEKANLIEFGTTRREFLETALAAGAGLALGAMLPGFTETAEAQPACTVPVGQTLVEIGKIEKPQGSTGQLVRGVIKILNEKKSYLRAAQSGGTVCESGQMRYFAGLLPNGQQVWPLPAQKGLPAPGPTIRARVGDLVEITLMNQVDVNSFARSIDAGTALPLDQGNGCDQVTSTGPGGVSVNSYPGTPPFDEMPNCFHGSSTVNLHYHGTHISPNVLEDNIFLQLRPSPRANGQPVVNEQYLESHQFNQIFANCRMGRSPKLWTDLPPGWQQAQETLLKHYDASARLPLNEQLWPKNYKAIHDMPPRWPMYFIGAYPSCFKLPVWNNQPNSMGQSPGTHWYHAHKHGSTALNLADGMAGAFIIEGPYDDALKPLYNKEIVLVLQQYDAVTNLDRAAGTGVGEQVYVNGQFQPVLQMQPGEVQFWRIVNACHQKTVPINGPAQPGLRWIQTAQDGVQLHPNNYALGVSIAQQGGKWTNATLTTPMVAPPWFGNLAPGNRVDMLVQAPSTGGTFPITFGGGKTLLLNVNVSGTPIRNPISFPPAKSAFPSMPLFLEDIGPARIHRDIRFKSTPPAGRAPVTNVPPSHTINGHKFEDHHFQETVQLGDTEEWTLYNDNPDAKGAAHPFHIHVNPFQVVAIKTGPNKPEIQLPTPWIWWDDIALPPGGYVRMRSRFVDFTGAYVLHCHILGHEDRGMMEMVEVVSNVTTLEHD